MPNVEEHLMSEQSFKLRTNKTRGGDTNKMVQRKDSEARVSADYVFNAAGIMFLNDGVWVFAGGLCRFLPALGGFSFADMWRSLKQGLRVVFKPWGLFIFSE